ncbi:putative Undecaprenyl-phosphate galactose phosphotransferase [Hyella patelloides LEGE 07179]|uniref:Putative Undecaprenyl-phosphate galactose phosphotransferase n=1 Tax=Hyella patelloides LEGE 07179 TaxID=945734 RepID=A0A563VWZ1_9CYAN|nr:heterocyst development glycosyltransferase HepC [Hyella patelloides]VEP15936.1 putative Undecaprenyl-phosphate galactose phosphotransferase [Hyella patelloides LEGE 07179]
MSKNNVWITAFKTIDLSFDSSKNSPSTSPRHVRWRNKILWVSTNGGMGLSELPALKSQWWLINCLKKSPIDKICLTPQLEAAEAEIWAKAGKKAQKKVFLRTLRDRKLFLLQNSWAWNLKRSIDFVMALLILWLLSPVMLVMIGKQKLAGKPIFEKQRCVGKKGLLFETFHFTRNRSGRRAFKFSLNNLPQLINVLRGEMSFVGRYPYSLDEALSLNDQQRKVLNVVPGIVGSQFQRLPQADTPDIFLQDREYLTNWSLGLDLKTLLLHLPLALLGKSPSQKTT